MLSKLYSLKNTPGFFFIYILLFCILGLTIMGFILGWVYSAHGGRRADRLRRAGRVRWEIRGARESALAKRSSSSAKRTVVLRLSLCASSSAGARGGQALWNTRTVQRGARTRSRRYTLLWQT